MLVFEDAVVTGFLMLDNHNSRVYDATDLNETDMKPLEANL